MSSALTLARPYARAAFDLAQKAGALAAWSDKLGFAAQLSQAPAVAALVGNPRLSAGERLTLLLPPGEAAESGFANFLSLLADNGRLAVLPQIAELYEQHRADAERTLAVTVRSASAIDADQLQRMKAALDKRFQRDVQLSIHIEPELLGGAIIDAGDVVIDGSLRHKLDRLKHGLVA